MKELILYFIAEAGGVILFQQTTSWKAFLWLLIPAVTFFALFEYWFVERSRD